MVIPSLEACGARGEELSGQKRKGSWLSHVRSYNLAKIRLCLTLIGVEVCVLGWVKN